MSTIAERVAAGAAFLDRKEPGWVDRIDLTGSTSTVPADAFSDSSMVTISLGRKSYGLTILPALNLALQVRSVRQMRDTYRAMRNSMPPSPMPGEC